MTLDQAIAIWQRAIRIMPGFSVEPDPIDVLKASIELNLSTYDSEYVVLARMRKLKLVTGDKQILEAVPNLAVSIEDFAAGK
jgi:predicted nucleic acid-binding protein